MSRLASAVVFGAACAGIAYAAGATTPWTVTVGLIAAAVLWALARR